MTHAEVLGTGYVVVMARYNAWMNDKLYAAAARLPEAEVMRGRGAFFGSIFGTLGHLVVTDTIWLKRFASVDAHAAALAAHRRALDDLIVRWVATLDAAALAAIVPYDNLRGDHFARPLFALLMHVFNHQTHHRGQATTLLTQAGEDVGATDLVAMPVDG